MTPAQRLQLRASEIRSRLNELGTSEDDLTDELRSEIDTLTAEYRDVETRRRALIVAESEKAPPEKADTQFEKLASEVRCSRYLGAFVEDKRVTDGPEAELRQELEVGDDVIPWEAMALPEIRAGATEKRADAATSITNTIPTSQASILERVFARSATRFLGVSMPQVPAGERSYPVMTGGDTPAFTAKATAKDAVAASFSTADLEPIRLTGRYLFAVEDVARFPGLEMALRRDLSDAAADALDQVTINGSGTAPVPGGFLATAAKGGLAAGTAPSAVATFPTYAALAAEGVDGKFAHRESEVRLLIGDETYRHAAALIASGTATSAANYMALHAGGLMASANIPDAASNVQNGILRRGSMPMEAVCPMWGGGLRIIRDPYTGAASGQVALTLIALMNFKIVRDDSYKRIRIQIAS